MSASPASFAELWSALTANREPFGAVADEVPAICLNMVMSVDGATTLGGRVGALTGAADQRLLYRLRAEADAVLVGAQTVRTEGYRHLLRSEDRRRRARERGSAEPLLCIVSGRLALPDGSPALGEASTPLVFLTSSRATLPQAARPVAAIRSDDASPAGALRLRPLLRRLREEFGVDRVVCEGGSTLNAALFAEGLVQELFVSLSPLLAQQAVSPKLVAGEERPVPLELVAHAAAEDFVFLRYRRRDRVPLEGTP
jgi:riboflavin biosynthesis pyrimidine reductase